MRLHFVHANLKSLSCDIVGKEYYKSYKKANYLVITLGINGFIWVVTS